MLKKIKNIMEEYMYDTTTSSRQSFNVEEQCYVFGYLDGYFDEKVYFEYILSTINNETCLETYQKGFDKGNFDKKRANIYEPKVLKNDKIEWIKKLALHDTLNNVEFRNLKENSLNAYNSYKNGTFNLGKMDFVQDIDTHKIKR